MPTFIPDWPTLAAFTLRDPEFACAYGSTASIMAYGRLNYVAQPEDGVPPECLMPRVGPYDLHAIAWGYTPGLDAAALDALAERGEDDPWLLWRRAARCPA